MNTTLQAINALLALAEAGSQIASVTSQYTALLAKANAENRDVTQAELDGLADTRRTTLAAFKANLGL